MLAVPHRRQRTAFTCGPASVRMVLEYYGLETAEADIAAAVGCSSEHGSSPASIARYIRKRGLTARSRGNLTLSRLRADLERGFPAIVAYQAWAGPGVDLKSTLEHGHYAVAIGARADRVTLADPSAKKPRLHIPAEEFLERWHDVDSSGKHFFRWALTVRPKT